MKVFNIHNFGTYNEQVMKRKGQNFERVIYFKNSSTKRRKFKRTPY